ncbi:MAG TPA: MarR family transcriptional regulator [Acidimicrobiales bacterium]|nr:MarR family transcriptional regulator [Acidimicrobiales bacterium]
MDDLPLAAYGRSIAQLARVVENSLGGLTLSAYRILSLVAEGNERSSQIAGRLALARPTISNAVDQLVERGLLRRGANAEDRRAVVLTVTDDGRAAIGEADRAIAQRLRPIFERLGDPPAVLRSMEQVMAAAGEVRAERRGTAAAGRRELHT